MNERHSHLAPDHVFCCNIEITNHVALRLPGLLTTTTTVSFSYDLRLSPKAGRVPVGAAVTQNSLNDLMVIQSISLQQRNLSALEKSQYELDTV